MCLFGLVLFNLYWQMCHQSLSFILFLYIQYYLSSHLCFSIIFTDYDFWASTSSWIFLSFNFRKIFYSLHLYNKTSDHKNFINLYRQKVYAEEQGRITTLLPLVSIVSIIVMSGCRCHSGIGIILARVVTYSPLCVSLGSSGSGICASSIFLIPSGFAMGLSDVLFSQDVETPVVIHLSSTILSLARNKRWISHASSMYFSL